MASLRADAIAVWQAGVEAVRSERLVGNVLVCTSEQLTVCGYVYPLLDVDRIVVVGAGKAGAGMATAVEQILGPTFGDRLTGWVNVPADCVRPLRHIHLHAARPAGVNEPTAEGVAGSEEILRLAESVGPRDACLVLISGGGSALLPAPVPPISLADKQAVTRFLMQSGADISQLNTVRKQLSRIKGGGLARAVRAGSVQTLIISDVVGDPLEIIASGPTAADSSTPAAALEVLKQFGAAPPHVPQSIFDYLQSRSAHSSSRQCAVPVHNHVIGNNATALAAATAEARRRGYAVHSMGTDNTGEANEVGRDLLAVCEQIRDRQTPVSPPCCVLSGGEPVVRLTPTTRPRKGGRNQQLVLSALDAAWSTGLNRIVLLSGGTDGEDGPTDAAGAWADDDVLSGARRRGLQPRDDLEIHNAYHFFEETHALLKTGPTHTNVMDLRVGIVGG